MEKGWLRTLGPLVLTATCSTLWVGSAVAQAKLASGKLAGVVRDSNGVPQLGANVEVTPEITGKLSKLDLLTDTQGIFRGDRISPGVYDVRVTLAGFLPTLQKQIRISANLTTVVRIQLESMFSSLKDLRHEPSGSPNQSDDWKWVLRTASITRPVLDWVDEDGATAAVGGAEGHAGQPRMKLEFTDGAEHPGSVSNLASSPATAFAYDQKLGGGSKLILAGEMSYEDAAETGGIATIWLPTGSLGAGPHTALVMRQAQLGPMGPTFRGVRVEEEGSIELGDRSELRYGGEYVLVGLGRAASSLRPKLELDTRISNLWSALIIYTGQQGSPETPIDSGKTEDGTLTAALNELDAFPALLWRHGQPTLQSGTHEELALERKLGKGKLQFAAFHDDDRHVAVFARGGDLPAAEYFQDYFSNGFAHDGGSSSNWGGRIAMQEKLDRGVEFTAVYALSGALVPGEDALGGPLRDELRTAERQSVGANISTKLPLTGAKVSFGYKWLQARAISRLDGYGESLFQTDPYLHVSVRQSLPKFGPGRWEATASCNNLLAQGYLPINSRDGRVTLVPAFRTFRGGLNLQF